MKPFVPSVARKGGVEAWLPDQIRHDASVLARRHRIVKRSRLPNEAEILLIWAENLVFFG